MNAEEARKLSEDYQATRREEFLKDIEDRIKSSCMLGWTSADVFSSSNSDKTYVMVKERYEPRGFKVSFTDFPESGSRIITIDWSK
jgi:hypothetical protein